MKKTRISINLLVFYGIWIFLIISPLCACVSAEENLTGFCPTREELITLFPWGGPSYWGDKDGDPYTYTCEPSQYDDRMETGRAYLSFNAESFADCYNNKGYRHERAKKVDAITVGVQIVARTDHLYDDITVEEWRSSEEPFDGTRLVFHDVSGIGDTAYAASFYWKLGQFASNDVFHTKMIRLQFVKGIYIVQVTLRGADEGEVQAHLTDASTYDGDTTKEPYPSENSVPTLEKITTIARYIDQQMAGTTPGGCTKGGVAPSDPCPVSGA